MRAWNQFPITIKENNTIIAMIPKRSEWLIEKDKAILRADSRIVRDVASIEWLHNLPKMRRYDELCDIINQTTEG